ncbi:YgjV family protein [Pseudoalteromonas sp. OFAV1]|uniref:YgjV family protein n=1 Tax=Pseudoalteromonas sp. OFAV1 TaxID=2908892 RepID=UPI001F2A9099|nr:YgjV family protein [Pseudoalteromonas sp. OFAV1]MCF2901144.1 YgjV family protein [Pseudoalteromonas sp. OFAV1]
MLNDVFLAQSIGILAMTIGFYAISLKDDKALLNYTILSAIVFVPHFLLLGSVISAISMGFVALRLWIAKESPPPLVMYVFLAMSLLQGLFFLENWNQLFSILASMGATFVSFRLRGLAMRVGFIFTCFCWIIDGILTGSWPVALMNFVSILIHIITIHRYFLRQS